MENIEPQEKTSVGIKISEVKSDDAKLAVNNIHVYLDHKEHIYDTEGVWFEGIDRSRYKGTLEYSDKGFVHHSIVRHRKDGIDPFKVIDGKILPQLDGYAIIPIEEYRELYESRSR